MSTVAINHIRVGDRVRADLGDLADLMASMSQLGQLQPVVLDGDLNLIAGARRLEAARRLGWPTVRAVSIARLDDASRALEAERDENTCRLPFTPSEMVELGRRLEEIERPRAEERMKAGRSEPSANFAEGSDRGETNEKVATAVGTSRENYRKARTVVAAAEAGAPQAQEAREEMDRTGKVDPAYRAVKAAKEAAAQSPEVRLAAARRDLGRLLGAAGDAAHRVLAWDGDDEVIDEDLMASFDFAADACAQVVQLRDKTRQARSGLRVVNGGTA